MIELAIYLFIILLIPASIAFLLVVVVQWYIIVTREPGLSACIAQVDEIVRCDGGGRA